MDPGKPVNISFPGLTAGFSLDGLQSSAEP